MPDAISLHVLCRYEGATPKGLKPVDKKVGTYDSISWRIKEDQAKALVGKLFCMHEAKSSPSYLGGKIIAISIEPIPDNDGEKRGIVRFKVSREGRGVNWPPTDNPNEYHRVNADVPLERLRKR